MKKACIDIGTNSVLCLIIDTSEPSKPIILEDFIDIVRLGEGMTGDGSQNIFQPNALERFDRTAKKIKNLIDQHQVKNVRTLATAAARRASNASELENICSKYDFALEIISGDEEANLTFNGANYNLDIQDYIVIDIGGGSTEILWREDKNLVGKSLDVGAVFLKEKFFKSDTYSDAELEAAQAYLITLLASMPAKPPNKKWIAVAGTPTTIAACEKSMIHYNASEIHGLALDRKILAKWLKRFNTSQEDRLKIAGLNPKRADIIFAGTLILDTIAKAYDVQSYTVSTGGLRFGAVK